MSDVIKTIAISEINSDDKIQILSRIATSYQQQISTIEQILKELLKGAEHDKI